MQISSLVGNAELKSILGDSSQTDSSSRPNSTISFIHSETVTSPATSCISNYKGQIYGESSQIQSTEIGVSESILSLSEEDHFFYNCN